MYFLQCSLRIVLGRAVAQRSFKKRYKPIRPTPLRFKNAGIISLRFLLREADEKGRIKKRPLRSPLATDVPSVVGVGDLFYKTDFA